MMADDGMTRGQFLGRLGAASALLAVGSTTLVTREAEAAIVFYNAGDASNWDYINGVAPNKLYEYTFSVVGCPARAGQTATRHEARYGDPDDYGGGGYHAECIKRGVGGRRGDIRWFGWSTFVPSTWEFITNPDRFEDTQVVTQQSIQSRNSQTGEAELASLLRIRGDRWQHATRIEGGGGGAENVVDLGPVTRGRWTDWVVQVKWASQPEGFVKIWKNPPLEDLGTPTKQYFNARTCWPNDQAIDFHWGVYPGRWLNTPPISGEPRTRVLFQDEVRIGDENVVRGVDVRPRGTACLP